MNNIQGWINLYKPKNISSFKAIDKVKKIYHLKKIGHAGTLDPLAEGILPIAVGKATKLIPFINNELKIYNFKINWGVQTFTDDNGGKIINECNIYPSLKDIELNIINYLGYIKQVPPRVSAVKIKGRRAYELARKNENFEIVSKDVFVKKLSIIRHEQKKTYFRIECGKGFYVRSFARDLAKNLKTFGHISYLEREKVGKFSKKTSILLDDLLKIGQRHNDINCILPTISMLDDILAYEIVDQKNMLDLSFGRSIKIEELKYLNSSLDQPDKKMVFLSNNGDIVSIGKLEGNLFKPNKILL